MDVKSELIDAQVEVRATDNAYSANRKGLIWFNKTLDKIRAVFNGQVKSIATEDFVTQSLFESIPVGVVQLAMLTEAQFQADYGVKWLKMEGQTLLASSYPDLASRRPEWVSGSDLVLPTGGDFLRVNTARDLGSFEEDEIKEHSHLTFTLTSGSGALTDENTANYRNVIASNSGNYTIGGSANDADAGKTSLTGGTETRPKNIAINAFIKVLP